MVQSYYNNTKNTINKELTNGNDYSLTIINNAFKYIRSNVNLRRLIEEVLTNELLLMHVANSSYSHVNGFDKIVLMKFHTDHALRIHIWSPVIHEEHLVEDVHNHRWHFGSEVITGRVPFELWQQDTNGTNFFEYRCMITRQAPSFDLVYAGPSSLNMYFSGEITAGSYYIMPSQTLHRVRSSDLHTITLVLQGAPHYEFSRVFSAFTNLKSERTEVQRMTKEQLTLKLIQCLTYL